MYVCMTAYSLPGRVLQLRQPSVAGRFHGLDSAREVTKEGGKGGGRGGGGGGGGEGEGGKGWEEVSQGEREDRDEGTGGERGKEAESVMEERGRSQEEDDSKRRYWNSICFFTTLQTRNGLRESKV